MNRKGFTLVELLATIVILGIIMVVAIPNVVGILNNNRNKTYVEDAKKFISNAEYALRSNKVQKPNSTNNCVAFRLDYLDNGEFENPPYGKEYDKERSFVVVKYNSGKYEYWVDLLEKMDDTNKKFRGVIEASPTTTKDSCVQSTKKCNLSTEKVGDLVAEINDTTGTDVTTIVASSYRSNIVCGCKKICKYYGDGTTDCVSAVSWMKTCLM